MKSILILLLIFCSLAFAQTRDDVQDQHIATIADVLTEHIADPPPTIILEAEKIESDTLPPAWLDKTFASTLAVIALLVIISLGLAIRRAILDYRRRAEDATT